MMKRYRKYLKPQKSSNSNINVEEFRISHGCCFFHTKSELRNFIDVNDDVLEE